MKKIYKILIACSIALFIALGALFLVFNSSVAPLTSESNEITFNIPENTAPNTVLEQLEEQNVIKSSFFAKIVMKLDNLSNIKAGIYAVDSSWSTKEVLEYINIATNAITDEVLITIPEGLWSKDIAKKIEEVTNVTAQECLDLWNNKEFLNRMIQKYDFLDESIFNSEYHVALEGYLYPNSYYIFKDTTAEEVTVRLLDGFDTVYQSIKKDIDASKYSIHELVTFASVVQFESGKADEMPIIASVFHNRFETGMRMESSVTVCYALYDKFNDFMDCESNPKIDSPYNTYLNAGLPIGPVNNPGIDALNSVLHPAKTDYFYFIADVYGDSKLIPAKTYEEHLKNVQQYLQ